MFIDGFSGGLIPSKDAVREIRINQNPFSPEYDKLGYGRIEILTKPGASKFKRWVFLLRKSARSAEAPLSSASMLAALRSHSIRRTLACLSVTIGVRSAT